MEMIDYQITINMPYRWENGTLTLFIDKDIYVYGINDYTETQLAEPMEIACEFRGDTLYMVYDEYSVPLEYEGQISEKDTTALTQGKQDKEIEVNFEWQDISEDTIAIKKYIGNESNVVIPEEINGKKVVAINDEAFAGNEEIISILLPSSLTSIGGNAFAHCTNLSNITLPNGLNSIGVAAFADCSSLSSIAIPEGVAVIEPSTFRNCSSLSAITIPDSVRSIGDSAFHGCRNLPSVTIPDGITSISSQTFSDCLKLTSLTIPDSVTSIGIAAFENCTNLKVLLIPAGVTDIGKSAFGNCYSLKILVVPGSYGEQYCQELQTLRYSAASIITMNSPVVIPNVGETTVTDYLVWENLRKYNAGKHKVDPSSRNITVYHSGDSSRHAFIQVDIVNTTGNAINYLSDCTVYALAADGTVYEGWAHQYNWNNKTSNNSWGVWNGVQNKEFFIDEKDEFEIVPNETGHFCFGATLPREHLKGSDTLQLIIQMGETQIICSIIP